MSPLRDALERIEAWLRKHQVKLSMGLNQGLTRKEIDDILKGFPLQLPEEIYELYQWHNGKQMRCFDYFIPFFHWFWSLQEALEQYKYISQLWRNDDWWDRRWLTIFDCNGDYFYAVVLGSETSPVLYIDPEADIREIHYDSLTDLMLAVAESYETGAYYLDENGDLQQDSQKLAEVRRKYNFRGVEITESQ